MNSSLPSSQPASGLNRFMDRRGFVRTSVHAGAGMLLLTSKSAIAQQTSSERVIKCALIGCGAQGERLRASSADVPGVQWVAVCDIWPYPRTPMARKMGYDNKKRGYDAAVAEYQDVGEMLAKQTDIEAVFIATPDFLHAPHSRQCLEAKKAVYCEKMMSNTIEGARDMVKAQQETGGIFQIGHQRHSNPRYIHFRENIYKGPQLLGRVTHAYGQWNRGVSASKPLSPPKNQEIPTEILAKYGYDSMEAFLNWRWYKKYGGGAISDLGAHQIDMFNWVFQAKPTSVYAAGGIDYYDGKEGRAMFEYPDNVMTIYEYQLPTGTARTYYQVLTTTGSQGYYEKFMGINGSAIISESPTYNQVYAEPDNDWTQFSTGANPSVVQAGDDVKNKFWEQSRNWDKPKPPSYDLGPLAKALADVRESKPLARWEIPVTLSRFPHSPHIQNFIECARAKTPDKLTCPVQMAFESCVTVLTALKSIEQGAKVTFKPEDFVA